MYTNTLLFHVLKYEYEELAIALSQRSVGGHPALMDAMVAFFNPVMIVKVALLQRTVNIIVGSSHFVAQVPYAATLSICGIHHTKPKFVALSLPPIKYRCNIFFINASNGR